MKKYLRIWLKTTALTTQSQLVTRFASIIFILGKFFRFAFFIILLVVALAGKKTILNYNLGQIINFFLIFNLMDILGQLFYRGIYNLRSLVVSGSLDYYLIKPYNPIFSILTRVTDISDLPLLIVVILMLIKLNPNISFYNLILFIVILACGFVVITAIHIIIASIGIITCEVDHAVWIYRDLSLMARAPVDIYIMPIRAFLTFIMPIAVIFTFPAKALLGLLSWQWVVYSILFSIFSFLFSLKLWHFALTKYQSASS